METVINNRYLLQLLLLDHPSVTETILMSCPALLQNNHRRLRAGVFQLHVATSIACPLTDSPVLVALIHSSGIPRTPNLAPKHPPTSIAKGPKNCEGTNGDTPHLFGE
eukprot:Tbor_TRINITY_DN2989_c0_g1::TRINITY_DN2989_c0_g1_i1::g.1061::m.1061